MHIIVYANCIYKAIWRDKKTKSMMVINKKIGQGDVEFR